MQDICRMYNGDVIIPMPEMDESEKPSIANLLAQGVDQLAIRISSRMPDTDFPSIDMTNDRANERAHDARLAVLAWWDMNDLDLKFARSSRHYVGYGSTALLVKPVSANYFDKRKMPHWHVASPLNTFPAPSSDLDCIEPRDVIVLRQQTLAWLQARYPAQAHNLYKGKAARPDTIFDLLEYNDENETVLVVVGQKRGRYDYGDYAQGVSSCELLERYENRAGICLGVMAGRITMDRLQGHFDQIMGMFMTQAQLQAYALIGVRRTIFPEQWVVSHPQAPGEARIVAYADGKQGDIGEIANGTMLTVTPQISQMVGVEIDRMERNTRVGMQLPAEVGGEAGTNIRTAKRGSEVMGSAMDPNIGEAQMVYERLFQAADERAIALAKAEWGNRKVSFYMPKNGKQNGPGQYTPNDVFDSDFHFVKFSMPGVDAAGIPIEIGQRLQTKIMSLQTGREEDPMIEDAQAEGVQVQVEALEGSALAAIEQQAQLPQGAMDIHEIALMIQIRKSHPEWGIAEVIAEAQKQTQEKQAALAAQQPPPGAPPSPDQMPGMAQAPPPGAPPGGPPPGIAQILQQLRTPTNQSGAEQALSAPTPAPVGA